MLDMPVISVIKKHYNDIFSAERKVADYILTNPGRTIDFTVSELARESGVSDATVVRMCHHLGYKGYYQFRLMLAKDIGREYTQETCGQIKNTDVVSELFWEFSNTVLGIGDGLLHKTVERSIKLISSCNRVHILAVGNTTPLALYMGFRLGRLGIKCSYGIAPEYFLNHVNLAEKDDIVLAISQSGSSNAVLQGMELAKQKKLKTIAITGYEYSPLAKIADYSLYSIEKKERFDFYKSYSHLGEFVIIDLLIRLLMDVKKIKETNANKPEEMLSEYKW